jgi:hypothetical protein
LVEHIQTGYKWKVEGIFLSILVHVELLFSHFALYTCHQTYFSRSILLTMPAFTTAKLLGSQLSDSREKGVDNMPLAPAAAQSMQEIYYPPVVGVYLAYPNDAFKVCDNYNYLDVVFFLLTEVSFYCY